MAWTAPMTAVANDIFTAAQFNTNIRDNFLETSPAKATTIGSFFVGTGTNSIAERIPATIQAGTPGVDETTTSTTFTSTLSASTGPAVTVTTGTNALVVVTSQLSNDTLNQNSYVGYAVSGATTIASGDDKALVVQCDVANHILRASHVTMESALTPGSNTFTLQYRSTAASTGKYRVRSLTVIPF